MLIPSIDLLGGRIVQLVQGEKLKLAFDDFEYWIERFSTYPLVQLIDLDAAMRQGDNAALVERICLRLPCQVGGGIHTIGKAQTMLSAGARRVILGSALFRSADDASDPTSSPSLVNTEFATQLADAIGTGKIVAGIDSRHGCVAIKGWKESISITPADAIAALEAHCSGFLYTHIDTEGTMRGFPMDVARKLRAATRRQLIVAGGIREQAEIDELDRMSVDAVSGMAIYTGMLKA
jgi:phosphoribosylformimino-5-aminoimidazole carboxamide ribotide isomerase